MEVISAPPAISARVGPCLIVVLSTEFLITSGCTELLTTALIVEVLTISL